MLMESKLRPYFQGHYIMIKTNYLILQVLKKSNLVGRMVCWVVELYEYDVHFIPRGSIKSQVLVDILTDFSSLEGEQTPYIWIFPWTMPQTWREVALE